MMNGTRFNLWLCGMATLLLGMAGCADNTPVRIGFMAGISGRVADLGISGRNGAMLAVEQANQAGGINGRPVELLIRDDAQKAEQAQRALRELLAENVAALIGPMTSAMCMAILDQINAAQLVTMSPTCTSTQLSNRDDYFFRVIGSTTEYAEKSAEHQMNALGRRRFAVVYDLGNRDYTESWLTSFRQYAERRGGEIVQVMTFTSGPDVPLANLARSLMRLPADAILIIANSVDTAGLALQLSRHDNRLPIVTSEWSATERLIELGGRAVEGMVLAQYLDRESRYPDYLSFRSAYLKRFGVEPGFAGLAGYDAAKVVLDALHGKPQGQPLKQRLTAIGRFKGAAGVMVFDASGDVQRTTYLTQIREGRFLTLK